MEFCKRILNLTIFFLFASSSSALDSITPDQPLKDTGDTLLSHGGQFELAFFNIGVKGRYLGIRYHNFAKANIIWVANRNFPLNDTSGVLTLTPQGTLLLSSNTTSFPREIWSTNVSTPTSAQKNPIARLLNTGNLVVGNSNSSLEFEDDDYLWESFDYPGNTFMPNMKFGRNLVTGLDKYLLSWKLDNEDPTDGQFSNKLDPSGYPQIFLRKENQIVFRSGPWNGERFSGMPNLKPNEIYTFEFVINEKEIYYRYNLVDSKNVVSRMVLSSTNGDLQRWTSVDKQEDWNLYLTAQMDNCDRFNRCGPYGSCNINNSPPCECFDGFEPKDLMAWNAGYWGDGCVRRVQLECGKDGFKKISGLKLPDTRNVVYNKDLSLKECERLCHQNCSCTAYANSDIRNGGSGCLLWFDKLIDIRVYSTEGEDLYVRLPASELDNGATRRKIAIIVAPVLSVATVFILWLILHRRKQKKLTRRGVRSISLKTTSDESSGAQTKENDLELPLIDFVEIEKATQNFSLENKLGGGGFGLVYKGMWNDGQEVAVKRLSKYSKQGIDEFKNEVSCIAKLQHRNLVKLLGCYIQEEEKILIYEYMPNKSLDFFIFDRTKSKELEWPKRLVIIHGIARGILYLHHDSRLRIIHRDLKASNILLDQTLNPKISDFGMARIFGGDENDHANTNRIVGTYGYMAPEYAIDGHISVKSDVFSFGVLVLEIISGKKNRGFTHPDHELIFLDM
ncbi:hypothetical protein RDABS01_032323 [Bienertia sinuspersici]